MLRNSYANYKKVPTLDNEGRSVLFYATLGGNKNSFELLRQIEPDSMTCIHKRSYDGKTLLHIGNHKFVMFFYNIYNSCSISLIPNDSTYSSIDTA